MPSDAKKPTLSGAITTIEGDPEVNPNLGVPWGKLTVIQYCALFLGAIRGFLETLVARTPASAERTPTLTLATASGNVAAGSRSVIFGLSSDFEGTIGGATVDPADFASIPFVASDGDTLGAIAYTITAGSILIARVA